MEYGLKKRKPNIGYVTQCLYTPDVKYILRHFYLNLQKCCSPLNTVLPKWINNQRAGYEHGVNIIIADFIDMMEFNFCDIVIQLNYNYLDIIKNIYRFVLE